MKVLITGGTGFVGRHLATFLSDRHHEITVLARKINEEFFDERTGCIEADITVKEEVQAAIIFGQPDVVIHCAAMSKPNDCEMDRTLCYLTNVTATQTITEACKAINAKLIFLSTDFVFGHYGPYAEDAAYDPVNYYGESKMLAEQFIQQSGIAYAIVRTVLVVGKKPDGGSGTFLHWVKANVEAGKTISVYTDQQRNITYVNDLCVGIHSIITTGFEGIVHLCGKEIFTPYTLAKTVAKYFKFDDALILPVTATQRPEPAVRPQNSVLEITKAQQELGYTATPVADMIAQIFT